MRINHLGSDVNTRFPASGCEGKYNIVASEPARLRDQLSQAPDMWHSLTSLGKEVCGYRITDQLCPGTLFRDHHRELL